MRQNTPPGYWTLVLGKAKRSPPVVWCLRHPVQPRDEGTVLNELRRDASCVHPRSMRQFFPTRRRFLQSSVLLAGAPLILSRRIRAQGTAPSQRLTLGCIGIGIMGRSLLNNCVQREDVQVLAVCDVDTTRREAARRSVEEAYSKLTNASYRGCTEHNDIREVIARRDIDAGLIAAPEHWHARMEIAAVAAGKDVYCEKPLTHTIHEAVQLVQAVRRADRVFQTGSQQRSQNNFRVAAELVRNGVVGRVNSIHVSFGDPATRCSFPAEPMEPGLDWNLWCGPGPLVDYSPELSPRGVHTTYPPWRQTWEFGGGAITNWGAHHIDIAQWALGKDGSGPVEVRAPQGWEAAKRGAQLVYADGTLLTHVRGRAAVTFHGTEGQIDVDRGKFALV